MELSLEERDWLLRRIATQRKGEAKALEQAAKRRA
jgi:hypothetical protein